MGAASAALDSSRSRGRLRWRWAFAGFCLLALYVLVTVLFAPSPDPKGDEGPLLSTATRLLHGGYADHGNPDATEWIWHGPGVPLLLVPMVALHLPLAVVRALVGPPLLLLAAVLIHRLLGRAVAPRLARRGAVAFALFVPLWGLLPQFRKEPLALVLLVGGLLATAHALGGDGRRFAVLAGLCFGGLALTRLEYGWVVVGLFVVWTVRWLVVARDRRRARSLVLAYGVALLVCVPWLLYTHSLTGKVAYWGNASGLSLFWMAPGSPSSLGDWHGIPEVLRDERLASERPFFVALARHPPLERDVILQRVARRRIRADPARYVRNLAANASRMLFGFPFTFGRPLVATVAYALLSAVLLGWVAWALVRLRRRREDLPRETLPFALFGVLTFLVHLPPSAEPRMLTLLVPLFGWAIVLALGRRPA